MNHKVDKFIKKQITKNPETLDVMLLPVDSDKYILFGKYIISKVDNYYSVKNDSIEKTFNTLKTAITWCVFKEKNKTVECRKIEELDFKLSSLEIDLTQKRKILNNMTDENFKTVYIIKIEEDNIKKSFLLKQLNRFINISKDWQSKSFDKAKTRNKR